MWSVFGRSVRGASHRRRQLPNQDAIGWTTNPSGDLILAVADGHGSAACFRSEIGATLAIQTSLALFTQKRYLDDVEREFKHELITNWRQAVTQDLDRNPLSAAEELVVARRSPYTAYGTTLLVAVAGESQLVLLQIGDGDILMVNADGQVKRPWPGDKRLIGNETTSLCTDDAAANIRLRVVTQESPKLVLLSTDGYANSFRADSGFLKVGKDLLEMIEEEGPASVEQDLEGWLNEASNLGSGDDVTLGVLFRAA